MPSATVPSATVPRANLISERQSVMAAQVTKVL